jgi:PKD repeat protein
MKNLIKILTLFLISFSNYSQNEMHGYEYWFDNDYPNKISTNITPTSVLSVNSNIPTTGLSTGIHTFNFRSFDAEGLYSSVLSQFFYKIPESISSTTNNLVAYEYWFDNEYASAQTVNTPFQANVNINELITTPGLTSGIHTFNIRFKDNAGLWSSVVSQFFYKIPESISSTTNNLVAYEYWFDNDYTSVQTVNTPVQEQVNINELITTPSLTSGIHTFNIRFKDEAGLWSSVVSQFFYKIPESISSTTNNLVAYEYWFDNDYTSVQTVNTPVQEQVNINELITTPSLTSGIHTFNIRFKDEAGLWSSVVSQFFYKIPETISSTTNNLVAYEYWFDNDYASAQTVNTPVQEQVNINELIQTSVLNNGIHTFNIRFKDEGELWSSVVSQFFYKVPEIDATNNLITAYRYWLNDDFSEATFVQLITPVNQLNINENLDFTMIPKDTYTIHFQFKDSLGLWSSVTTDTIIKMPLPIPIFEADSTLFCDAGTVSFINSSIDGDTYLWDFGDGNTSQDTIPTHTYAQPGTYTVSLTAYDLSTPIDSTVMETQLIVIYETPSPVLNVIGNDTICEGTFTSIEATNNANYLWNTGVTSQQMTTDTAGNYWATVSNIDFSQCSRKYRYTFDNSYRKSRCKHYLKQ